jgi:hypothetical protein
MFDNEASNRDNDAVLDAADVSDHFDEGFQLGAKVEHRVAVEAVATALLEILGKDAGDGIINLGAAGWWGKSSGRWEHVGPPGAMPERWDYRNRVGGATK